MPLDFQARIADYYNQKPDFLQLSTNIKNNADQATFTANMPVHPKEEEATGSMFHPVLRTPTVHTILPRGLYPRACVVD